MHFSIFYENWLRRIERKFLLMSFMVNNILPLTFFVLFLSFWFWCLLDYWLNAPGICGPLLPWENSQGQDPDQGLYLGLDLDQDPGLGQGRDPVPEVEEGL